MSGQQLSTDQRTSTVSHLRAPTTAVQPGEARLIPVQPAQFDESRRIPPTVFGVSFGLAGLAEGWNAAARFFAVPLLVADIIWVFAAAAWAVALTVYLRYVRTLPRLREQLRDPTFAPFTALAVVIPMLFGAALAEHARLAGVIIYVVSLVLTALLGAYLIGQWIASDLRLADWHSGYFLPTVAGGFLASVVASQLHYPSLAKVMFGYGAVSWMIIGSTLLQRLFTEPRLPVNLLPTMAIQVAPPVIAGVAWFSVNGGRVDGIALGLGGYAGLMVLVQLRLLPLYRTVPFGLSWWAFAFSYAAVFVQAIRWLAAEHVEHGQAWAYALLAVPTTASLILILRSAVAIRAGTFLPGGAEPAAD
jgi:tellurite resistance protein